MEEELINTFKLVLGTINQTLQLKEELRTANLLGLVDNIKFIYYRLTICSQKNIKDANKRKTETKRITDIINDIAEGIKNTIREHPENYNINNTDKLDKSTFLEIPFKTNKDSKLDESTFIEISNNNQEKDKLDNSNYIQIEDNSDNIPIIELKEEEEENLQEFVDKLIESDNSIKLPTTNTKNNNKFISSFKNITYCKNGDHYSLYLDKTKYRKIYRTNYMFASENLTMINQIIQDVKDNSELKKSLVVEKRINGKILYYLFTLSKKEFFICKYMKWYLTRDFEKYSIDNRYLKLKTFGRIVSETDYK